MTNEKRTNEVSERGDDPRATAYVLDELSAEERERFERELAGDAGLAAEVCALDALATRLRGTLSDGAEPKLDDARRSAILNAGSARVPPLPRRVILRVAVAAGVLALIGVGSLLTLNSSKPKRMEVASVPATVEHEEPAFTFGTTAGAFTSLSEDVRETTEQISSSLIPPLDPGTAMFNGGSEGAFTLQEESALKGLGYGENSATAMRPFSLGASGGTSGPQATYSWRDTSIALDRTGPGLRNLLQSEPPGTEAYDAIAESGFSDPRRQPLSTFSIDVDTASYANVRRFLNERSLPPADAVRIEELVNYFRYDYPEPRGAVPFSVVVDSASAPWASEHRLVRIGLRGRAPEFTKPCVKNLVFLVDVSGSMDDPAKLPLVQRSLRLLVDQLAPEDRVALVVYAGSSGLVLPSTSVDARGRILEAIENLKAGGSTNGGSGIQLAYKTAREHLAKDGVNRVILATDGDFNVGVTDRDELLRLIEGEAKSGVFLSVLGFGTGNLKDATMEQLADHGNGNYAYVDSLAEARKVLVREMGATLQTIAKDVKIQVEFNPARVSAWRLIGYENRALAARDFNDDKKDAGEIGAGHTVTALYEIVPAGAELAHVDALRYQDVAPRAVADSASSELLTVKLRYKQPNADASELLSVPFTDEGRAFDQSAPDLRFAAAVAAFGMCLRDSQLRGNTTLRDVYRWAEPALGQDKDGDRREFLKLVDLAAGLSGR